MASPNGVLFGECGAKDQFLAYFGECFGVIACGVVPLVEPVDHAEAILIDVTPVGSASKGCFLPKLSAKRTVEDEAV